MSDTTSDQPHLTQAAYDRLKTELNELITSGRKQMAERLQRARELGDLSENAEYHETKNQQGMMEARIRKIEHTLKMAQIVETPIETDHAQPGTIVTLKPLDGGDDEMYLLAASSEERARSVRTVTIASPLGQALSGRVIGDKVEYVAPGGTFSYEVVNLQPWDGQA
ncbi:MAG: transcription elongation factor GreA [Actinomycetota bacterium]